MATSVTLNSTSYEIPAVGEDDWGTDVSDYLVALSTGVLSKAGGSFTLTAEVDFGATFGVKSAYYKSRGSAATAGIVRLANDETVSWRDNAGSSNLDLKVNSSDLLEFNGNPLVTLALGSAEDVLAMNAGGTAYEWDKIVNANIDAAAAIAYSKLDLTGEILDADINASAAIAYSKLAISSSVSATELGYVAGVTSAIQTQLNAKIDDFSGSTDNVIVRTDGTGGDAIQESGISIDDSDNITGVNNLTVGGDLTVNGTTTTVNTSTLEVADANIVVNDGGDQSSANTNVAGLTVEMSDATDAVIGYDSSLASKWKAGESGSESEVITASASQTLTNKTLTDPSIDASIVGAELGSAPSTPSSGNRKLYAKSDGWYDLDDSGVELPIGSGSGGGVFNYVANPDASSDASTDITVAGSGFTVTRGTTAATFSDSYFNITGNTTINKTVDWDLDTLNEKHDGAFMRFSFNALLDLDSGSSGVYKIGVYNSSDSEYVTGTEKTLVDGQNTHFEGYFILDRSKTYVVRLEATTAGNSADVIYVDDIKVTPFETVFGNSDTDWTSFTATSLLSTGGASTINVSNKRRIGDELALEFEFTMTNDGTGGTNDVTVTLPDSLTHFGATDTLQIVGYGYGRLEGSPDTNIPIFVRQRGNGTQLLFYTDDVNGVRSQDVGTSSGRISTIGFKAFVRIQEWSGQQVTVANSQFEYAYNTDTSTSDDTSSFGSGPGGNTIGSIGSTSSGTTRRVQFDNDIKETDKLFIQISRDRDRWLDVPAAFNAGALVEDLGSDGSNFVGVGFYENSSQAANEIDVRFGRYRFGTTDWSSLSSYYWRVLKCSNPLGIGTKPATTTEYGSVKKNRFAKIELSSNVTATSSDISATSGNSAFYFSNLVAGRIYRLVMGATFQYLGDGAGNPDDRGISMTAVHDSTDVLVIEDRRDSASTASGDVDQNQIIGETVFEATGTGITFECFQLTSDHRLLAGGSSGHRTFARLEELNNYESAGSAFT